MLKALLLLMRSPALLMQSKFSIFSLPIRVQRVGAPTREDHSQIATRTYSGSSYEKHMTIEDKVCVQTDALTVNTARALREMAPPSGIHSPALPR